MLYLVACRLELASSKSASGDGTGDLENGVCCCNIEESNLLDDIFKLFIFVLV